MLCARGKRQIARPIKSRLEIEPNVELVHSMAGVGAETSLKELALALLVGVRKLMNGLALSALIGLKPRLKESVSSVRGRSMMSRAGKSEMRRAL